MRRYLAHSSNWIALSRSTTVSLSQDFPGCTSRDGSCRRYTAPRRIGCISSGMSRQRRRSRWIGVSRGFLALKMFKELPYKIEDIPEVDAVSVSSLISDRAVATVVVSTVIVTSMSSSSSLLMLSTDLAYRSLSTAFKQPRLHGIISPH